MQQILKSLLTVKYPSFSELYGYLLSKDLENLKNKKLKKVLKKEDIFYFIFEEKILKVCFSKEFYRISLLSSGEITGKKAEFSELLEDFKLKEIEIPKGERIFIFNLKGISRLYEPLQRNLIIEMLGRYKNIIITDERGKTIYDLRKKYKNKNYILPPSKINIFETESPDWENYSEKYFEHYIKYFGKEKFKELLEELNPYEIKSFYLVYEDKKPVFITPWEIKKENKVFERISEAIEELFYFYEMKDKRVDKKEDKKLEKKIIELEKKLEKEKDYEKYLKMGELCILYKKDLEGKEGKFKLKDPLTNKEYEVEIKKEPLKAAEIYFRIYKNKKEKIKKILKKIEELKETGEKKEKIKRHKFLEFKSPSGFKVFVARKKEEANELTFHFASPWDYFLHIKDYPGPHVILRRNKNQRVPDEDLFFAAKLAVKFAKKKGKVEVIYTRRENVKPVKGQTGKVKLKSFKTIWIKED